MLFNEKFDLIVSLGEDCACTSYLRRFHLQKYSYPFDWLSNATFETRINLITSDFENFFNKEDLIPYPKKIDNANNKKYDLYQNKRNDFHYYHDFHTNITFDDEYENVNKKFNRRINRLFEEIDKSKNILFIWWSKDKLQDIDLVKKSYEKLKQKFFSKNIYLLLIENYEKEEILEFYEDNLLILHYDNASFQHNQKWNATMGHETNNTKIFKKINLNTSFYEKIKGVIYAICKAIISLTPNKNLRTRARQKLSLLFYHAKL